MVKCLCDGREERGLCDEGYERCLCDGRDMRKRFM